MLKYVQQWSELQGQPKAVAVLVHTGTLRGIWLGWVCLASGKFNLLLKKTDIRWAGAVSNLRQCLVWLIILSLWYIC